MICFLEEMFRLLYPKRCPICQVILTKRSEQICSVCRKKTVPLREPVCKKCGKPVMDAQQELCPDCYGKIHFFTKGRAVFLYEKEIKQSVYRFKFQNKREYGEFYSSEMARLFGKEILAWKPDALIPIPMYRRKQRRRGYNQAEVLARGLGEKLSIPVNTTYLKRIKKTIPQSELVKKEREINLKNAFKTSKNEVKLKKVLLIDDIYTTGVTMDEAAKALLCDGVKEVRFLVLCTGKTD